MARCRWALVAALVSTVVGCSGAGYYSQSVQGQLSLLAKQRSLSSMLEDRQVDPELRRKLERVAEMRDFAVAELGLPDNGSYRSYVHLDPPYVVWNVVAAPELSVTPITWCFPVAGCVSYRGYFSEKKARRFAAGLEADGFDTVVEGVAAYSTLGWFRDPLLSTFIDWPETRLAGLLFHELAHQRVYAKGDTVFNESYATVVERAGLERFLAGEEHAAALAGEETRRERREQFTRLVLETRRGLDELYRSSAPDASKRDRKAELLAELGEAYQELRESWDGWAGYDAWFDRELNNAHLASIGAYGELVEPLERLLAELGGDLDAFHREVEQLADLSYEERRQRLGVSGSSVAGEPLDLNARVVEARSTAEVGERVCHQGVGARTVERIVRPEALGKHRDSPA
jgi:predicted aminopeptidase